MNSRPTSMFALLAGALLLASCGGSEPSTDAAADTSTTTAAPPAESEASPSGLAEAIAGDVSWGWEPFRDRAEVGADDPELPRMQHVFVVGDQVWAEGVTDPPIGEAAEPVTAVIDPQTREFELFDTPGFGRVVVHDGVMWGFVEDTRSITTFTPEDGASEPIVVPEIAAVLDASTSSGPTIRFVALSDDRLFLQVEDTMFELDTSDPGSVTDSFDASELRPEADEYEPFRAAPAGEQVLYDWYGDGTLLLAGPGAAEATEIDDNGPQVEVLSSDEAVVWHRGSDLVTLDPATGQVETTSLTGAPTEVPSNAVHWDASTVTHMGDDNNPALHIAGSPTGVVAATAKRDEVVLVDLDSGAKAAIGHLYGDTTSFRPLVVGDEVWLWTADGQGIAILTFGAPLAEGEGPDVVGDTEQGEGPATDDDLADDPEYRSGRQQGRWDAETDLEGGWPADNDPDGYDPNASPEFKQGYVDGYDETYEAGDSGTAPSGDPSTGGTSTEEPPADDECAPGQSLQECYG